MSSSDNKQGHASPPYAAAIFDFDGTLVDTLPFHYEAYRRCFAENGLELTPADYFDNIGGIARETIPKFLRGRPCSRSPEELHRRKKEIVAGLLRTADIPKLETARLLDVFRGHLRLALASSGSREGIEILLKRLGWRDHFSAIVTGEDVARGKPAPDLFLRAAEMLSVSPAACIVFEDSDDGVRAAIAAGMTAFDVRATISRNNRSA